MPEKNALSNDCGFEPLLSNLGLLHTTDLGAERLRKNLQSDTDDVVS